MNDTLQQQLIRLGFAPSKQVRDTKYDGLWYCFKNVARTNNSKKLSYCKTR